MYEGTKNKGVYSWLVFEGGFGGKENMRLWTEEHTYKIFMNYVIITDFCNGDFMTFWQEIRRDTHLILKKDISSMDGNGRSRWQIWWQLNSRNNFPWS